MSTALANLANPAPSSLATAQHHHAQNHLLQAAEAYREALQTDPQNHQALFGLSLIAQQSNQLEPALHMAQAALAAAQNPTEAALAQAHIGDCHFALNQTHEAQSAFEQALKIHPELAAAHYGLGNAHALNENYSQAATSFARALNLCPQSPEAHFALAFALTKLAQLPHAIALYRQAIHLRPNFAAAWLNLGVALVAHGQPHPAQHCYQQALDVEPGNRHIQISSHLNHGHLYRTAKLYDQAQNHYESALQLAQTHRATQFARLAEIHIAFTYLHYEQNQLPQAWHSLSQAETSNLTAEIWDERSVKGPGFSRADKTDQSRGASAPEVSSPQQNPEIPNARGILLLAEEPFRVPHISNPRSLQCGIGLSLSPGPGDPPHSTLHTSHSSFLHQALAAFEQAESQGHKNAPSNRGNALLRLGRTEESLAAHEKAVALDPHHPGTRYNLALTQLRLGNYREGWQNYEIRWQFREVHPTPRHFPQPRWQGDPVEELFIYSEQGLGDTLQFLRYLPFVAQRLSSNSTLILEVQPPLLRLVEAHFAHSPHTSHSTLHTRVIPTEQNSHPSPTRFPY